MEDNIISEEDQANKILAEKFEDSEPLIKENDISTSPDIEDIEPQVAQKDWHVKSTYTVRMGNRVEEKEFNRIYTQKPMSVISFTEFTGLLGRSLAAAMRGPDGLSLDKITPGEASIPLEYNDGQITLSSDVMDIDPIIQGIAKIASYVPDLMAESQCIWLRVPRNERQLLIDIWSRPLDEGGMSVEEGEEMFRIFIEQNYGILTGFLKQYVRIKNTVQKMKKISAKES